YQMLLLLLLVASCAATPQKTIRKTLIKPTQHRLTTSRQDFSAVTVCFRFFTDLSREYASFSLALPSFYSGFVFYKTLNSLAMCVRDTCPNFEGLDFKLNKWHSVWGTWDAASGLAQLWLNGEPSSRKLTSKSNINGPITITLGQDQDSHGGGFEAKQSFVGMMSDLHMWDYKLSPCEIQKYVNDFGYAKGNVLNWNSLEFQIIGTVLVENKLKTCQ
uniref:Pentraxin family member n=1 Tax=Poecilia reticulata TaxID=8081 RepID=A0A3P9Q545_POERE